MLSGEGREDLAPSALAQLFANILDEVAFLRVQLFFWKIGGSGDQEWHEACGLWIEPLSPYLPDAEGMVRIEHEAMQHQAHEATIAAVGLKSPLNILLNSH